MPAVFFVAGLGTRLTLRTTETRWQMLAFALAALLVAVFAPHLPRRSMPFSAVAASAGILIAKFSIEGWPL